VKSRSWIHTILNLGLYQRHIQDHVPVCVLIQPESTHARRKETTAAVEIEAVEIEAVEIEAVEREVIRIKVVGIEIVETDTVKRGKVRTDAVEIVHT